MGAECVRRNGEKTEGEQRRLETAEGLMQALSLLSNSPSLSSCLLPRHCLSTVKGNLEWLSYFTLS